MIFDFGRPPVLARKLKVEIGEKTKLEKVLLLRKELEFDRLSLLTDSNFCKPITGPITGR